MSYQNEISVIGVLVCYWGKKIYIHQRSLGINKSLKQTLNELYSTEVSGNIHWMPLEIKETSYSINLVFLGIADHHLLSTDYFLKNIDNKLTVFEQLAIDNLRKEVKDLNPLYFELILGKEFLIRDLYNLYKLLVDKNKDRANFYKLIRKNNTIVPVGKRERDVYYRPPEYYKIES